MYTVTKDIYVDVRVTVRCDIQVIFVAITMNKLCISLLMNSRPEDAFIICIYVFNDGCHYCNFCIYLFDRVALIENNSSALWIIYYRFMFPLFFSAPL